MASVDTYKARAYEADYDFWQSKGISKEDADGKLTYQGIDLGKDSPLSKMVRVEMSKIVKSAGDTLTKAFTGKGRDQALEVAITSMEYWLNNAVSSFLSRTTQNEAVRVESGLPERVKSNGASTGSSVDIEV